MTLADAGRTKQKKTPKFCSVCNNIIKGQGKKFCTLHCWAIWANKTYKKSKSKPPKYCLFCDKLITKYGIKFCCIKCSSNYTTNTIEYKQKMQQLWEKRPRPFHSVATREKIRQIDLKLWSNKEWAIKKQKSLRLAQNIILNNKEILLKKILDLLFPNTWVFIGNGIHPIGGKHPDFYDNKNGIIELFGDYWHKGQNPQNKIDFFKNINYNCIVIWEHELQDKLKLEEKLLDWYHPDTFNNELGRTPGVVADSGILGKWVQL